jgi:ABC-type transport system involved in multi-copper enzyme maturation permease subunit
MNKPQAPAVIRWLVWDTYLQARESGLLWLLLGVNGLVILFCLSIGVGGEGVLRDSNGMEIVPRGDPEEDKARDPRHGVAIPGGELTLAFGAFRFPLDRDLGSAVRFLQLLLAWGFADTLGVLLTLIWTAGFMPRFLSRHTAPLVLAKPVSPALYVVGKFLGGVAFVALNAAVFFVGTWLAIGIRTEVWDLGYFYCIPLLLFHVAVFYAVSVLLAVLTRSTVACVIGTLAFWFLCWGMNYGHHMLVANPTGTPSGVLMLMADVCYWIFPKPVDLGMLLFDSLGAASYFNKLPELQNVERSTGYIPALSLLSSGLFALFTLGLASHEMSKRDY